MSGSLKALAALALVLQAAPAVVPVTEEPRHHLVFENKYVRVIDALVPAGDTTLMHAHALDNVPVVIAGGTMHTEVLGGATTDSTIVTGGTWFSAGGYAHRIKNTTATPLRFIDAEVVAASGAPTSAAVPAALPRHTLEVENAKVRIYRVTLEPGETTGPHSHRLPLLRVEVTGGRIAISSRGGDVLTLAPAQYQWIEGESRTLTNAGTSRYELIEIEWR